MGSSETPMTGTDGGNSSFEDQSSQAQPSKSRTKAKTDPSWAHCVEILDEAKKKMIRCMYCSDLFKGGGIHRFKRHLAGERGDVRICMKVPDEVRNEMKQSIVNFDDKKRKSQDVDVRILDDCVEVSAEDVATRAKRGKANQPVVRVPAKNKEPDRFFMSRTLPGDQPTLKSVIQSQEALERVDLLINKWFLDASIPFNATTSRYYQPMIDAIASVGSGYKGPSMYKMRGPLLAKNVENTKKFAESYRKNWKESGCTIMADGWTDRKKRTLINFLVYCRKDEWWSNYGCSAPHLQKLAIRVLSQTCSASGCERNWSLFEHVHSKKRNRLEHQRMNDIAYVHYNSRLEQSLQDISKFDENWILEDDPVVLSVEEIELFRKGCVPNDIEINCNMNDDDLVIEDDEDNDMDGSHSQGNDHTNMETAGEDANDGNEEEEDNEIDDDAPCGPITIDWNFLYH